MLGLYGNLAKLSDILRRLGVNSQGVAVAVFYELTRASDSDLDSDYECWHYF